MAPTRRAIAASLSARRSEHVAIGWCRCAIRKAQTLYDVDKFKRAGIDSDIVRTIDQACGAQSPADPTGQSG
jgi:hypothetical protein